MENHIVRSFDDDIEDLKIKIKNMALKCRDQIENAAVVLKTKDVTLAQNVVEADNNINQMQKEIEEASIRFLAKRQPMAVDLRQLVSSMKIASELERIGDYAANVAKRAARVSFPSFQEPLSLINEMTTICCSMIEQAMEAFSSLDIDQSVNVWKRDDEIDAHFAKMVALVEVQMQDETCPIEEGTQLMFIGRCCERIGDHITNIAENINYIITGQNYIGQFEDK